MNLFFICSILAILTLLGIFLRKKRAQKALLAIFQRYNENKDTRVLVHWIGEKQTPQRLTNALEFLRDIEEYSLAIEILDAFNLNNLQHRHILFFATQAYLAERHERALSMSDFLLEKYPGDDSVLDLFINVQLTMGSLEKAKAALMPRLGRKYKGTIFTRHYARVLAREGNLQKAIELMEQVSKRDFVLFQNTFATPQKGQIRQQFEESQALLEAFRAELEKEGG